MLRWTLVAMLLVPALVPVEQQRLAVSDLKADGVDAGTASMMTSLLAESLSRDPRFVVRDSQDLKALLVHDKEQQLVGCNDPACYVDISKLVGAEFIIVGKVGKVGSDFVLTASRITVDGTPAIRATARAKTIELLGRETPSLGAQLLKEKELPPPVSKDGAPAFVAKLANHDDCHWAAVRDVGEDGSLSNANRQVYQATFPASHFKLGKHVPLDEALYLEPSFYFLGDFHSCFVRQKDDLDAFNLADKNGLVVKAKTAQAADLRDAWRDRKLEVTLRFEIIGGKLNPSTPYDWENCEDKTTRPFRPTDISPTALIKVTAASLKDTRSDKTLALYRASGSGEDLTLEPIPGIE